LLITCVVLIGGAAIWFALASPYSKADKIEAPASTPLVRYQKSNPSTPLEKYGRLSVKGSTIVDESGNIVVLRGMSMFHCPDANRFKNANCVQWLRDDWKCEVIRYPMPTKESKRSYAQDPEGMMKDLATFVDACIDLGMYVIVDYHGGVDPLSHTEEATQLFDAISRKYGECPNLIYETFNEPHAKPKQKLSWTSEVKPFHEAVLQVIRKNAPDNLVLLGTPCFSLNIDEVLESPVTKFKNVVYVAHFYAATHKNGNREKVKKVIEAGFPVYISEFGTCTYTGDGKLDTESFSAWMDLLDQYHVGWCNWSVHDKNETASILKPKSSSLGGWEESQLTPSGKLIRQRLLDASQTHK
jgi:endoglucanase